MESNHPEAQSAAPIPGTPPAAELPSRLVLRDGLELYEYEGWTASSDYFVLEDSQQGKFYRVGAREAAFVKQLQRDPSLQKALDSQAPGLALTQPQVLQLCQWLQKASLLDGGDRESPLPVKQGGLLSSLFFLRIPVCNPDTWLRKLCSAAGFLCSWQASLVGMLLVVLGAGIAFTHWSEFLESYQNLFTAWRGWWIVAVWIALKIVHEAAHGMTCRYYGGKVPEAGLAMILFMPLAYVDVSSSWRLGSRWRRLHVTLAGVFIELAIAGLAMLVWLVSDSLAVRQAMADLVLAASFTSLLFNLNPLLKFDGYFALADLSGIDNLYQYGQSYARYFGSRYLLGLHPKMPDLPSRYRNFIKLYGLAAAVWRFVTVTGLLTGAAVLFAGAGIVLAIAGAFSFVVIPALRVIAALREQSLTSVLSWPRMALRLGLLASCTVIMLFLVPAEWQRTCPGIIEYDPPAVVRAPADGFIDEIYVHDGDAVVEGQPILRMRNDDLRVEIQDLSTRLRQEELRLKSARWKNDSSKLQEASTNIESLQQQLEKVESDFEQLVIRAPHNGKVAVRRMATLLGRYLQRGEEIGAVGNESSKRVRISVGEWQASHSEEWIGEPVQIAVPGATSWTSSVTRMDSRATEKLPHISLTAAGGGGLAVKEPEEDKANGADEPVLVEPRVNVYVSLNRERSLQLHCGQRCAARLACTGQSLGGQLWKWLNRSFLAMQ